MKKLDKEAKELSDFFKQFPVKDVFMRCPNCSKSTLWNNNAKWCGKNLQCTYCEEYNYYNEFTNNLEQAT